MPLGEGAVEIRIMAEDSLYYTILSQRSGIEIRDHADIDIPFGAKGDILINAALFHCYSSLRMFVSQR